MVVPEVSSRINGLLSGQYDFICDVPPDQIGTLAQNAKFEVQGGLISNHRILVFDKNHPRLADPRIRQAMTHAIDRQAIVDSLWAGKTRVPPGLQWEFYGPMFVEGWTVPEYDVKKAQALLKAANYKGEPIPFRVLNNYYTNQTATATSLYERLGGYDALAAAVDDLLPRLQGDPQLGVYWRGQNDHTKKRGRQR